MQKKVLVGITVQNNSKRLIDKGAQIAKQNNAQLLIVHVQKGDNIFSSEQAPELLQTLYEYGSKLGGQTYALCGEDVTKTIVDFIKTQNVTQIVVGEKPKDINSNIDIVEQMKKVLGDIEVIVLERQ